MAMVFEVLHPPLLPVTVYTVATVGLTITEVPVMAPGFHVYDAAPLPVRVAELPIHTAVAVAEANTVGVGNTVKLTTAKFGQPKPFKPTTV
jgi:hypothetical protein